MFIDRLVNKKAEVIEISEIWRSLAVKRVTVLLSSFESTRLYQVIQDFLL